MKTPFDELDWEARHFARWIRDGLPVAIYSGGPELWGVALHGDYPDTQCALKHRWPDRHPGAEVTIVRPVWTGPIFDDGPEYHVNDVFIALREDFGGDVRWGDLWTDGASVWYPAPPEHPPRPGLSAVAPLTPSPTASSGGS